MHDPSAEPTVPTDLPSIYETFDEARRASFINAMNYKQDGGKLCGYLCSYSPLELVDAAGAGAVGLCGMNNETIPDAEKPLPAYQRYVRFRAHEQVPVHVFLRHDPWRNHVRWQEKDV